MTKADGSMSAGGHVAAVMRTVVMVFAPSRAAAGKSGTSILHGGTMRALLYKGI